MWRLGYYHASFHRSIEFCFLAPLGRWGCLRLKFRDMLQHRREVALNWHSHQTQQFRGWSACRLAWSWCRRLGCAPACWGRSGSGNCCSCPSRCTLACRACWWLVLWLLTWPGSAGDIYPRRPSLSCCQAVCLCESTLGWAETFWKSELPRAWPCLPRMKHVVFTSPAVLSLMHSLMSVGVLFAVRLRPGGIIAISVLLCNGNMACGGMIVVCLRPCRVLWCVYGCVAVGGYHIATHWQGATVIARIVAMLMKVLTALILHIWSALLGLAIVRSALALHLWLALCHKSTMSVLSLLLIAVEESLQLDLHRVWTSLRQRAAQTQEALDQTHYLWLARMRRARPELLLHHSEVNHSRPAVFVNVVALHEWFFVPALGLLCRKLLDEVRLMAISSDLLIGLREPPNCVRNCGGSTSKPGGPLLLSAAAVGACCGIWYCPRSRREGGSRFWKPGGPLKLLLTRMLLRTPEPWSEFASCWLLWRSVVFLAEVA